MTNGNTLPIFVVEQWGIFPDTLKISIMETASSILTAKGYPLNEVNDLLIDLDIKTRDEWIERVERVETEDDEDKEWLAFTADGTPVNY